MDTKNLAALAMYIVGLMIALLSIIFTYIGLPRGLDTEPLLALAIFLVGIAGITSIKN